MQKRLLLVAVVLAGIGAGKARAGHYDIVGAQGLPHAETEAFTRSLTEMDNTQLVPLDDGTETKTTLWEWQPDGEADLIAPEASVNGFTSWSAATLTANAQGMESYASADARLDAFFYPMNPTGGIAGFYDPSAYAESHDEGPKAATIAASQGGTDNVGYEGVKPGIEGAPIGAYNWVSVDFTARIPNHYRLSKESSTQTAEVTIPAMSFEGIDIFLTPPAEVEW